MPHRKKLLFLPVCMMLIACQARVEGLSTPEQALTIQNTVSSPQSRPLPTEFKAKTSTPVQTAMMPSTPAPTHSSTPSKTAEPTLPPDLPTVESIQDCSTPLKLVSSGVVPEGSIIMVVWSDETRNWQIWAYSSKSGTPRMLKEIPDPSYNFRISPDGTQIGWVRAIDYDRELVVHDFITGEEQHYSPNVPWKIFSRWIDQEHVILIKDIPEPEADVGISYTTYQFDLLSQEITTITETFDLPGYSNSGRGLSIDNFLAITSDKKLALYTAFGEIGTDIVLRDLSLQHDIWRKSLRGYYPVSYPDWASDGQDAALAFWTKAGGQETYLFRLSRQGDLKPLVRLAPFVARQIISWSPDNRFLNYELASSFFMIETDGPGYLLDTLTGENKQICVPGEKHFNFIDWVDKGNQLAFAVGLDSGKSQLILMDPEKWEGQILIEGMDMAYLPDVYGMIDWTPLDLP